MPLIKSKSKGAFAHNVKAEIAAGKPPKQAVAIAYATKRDVGSHHSSHSAKRSDNYHSKTIDPNTVRMAPNKATRLEQNKMSDEDDILTGHTQKRHP